MHRVAGFEIGERALGEIADKGGFNKALLGIQ